MRSGRPCLALALALGLSACSSLPMAGPTKDAVLEEREPDGQGRYLVVDVTDPVVSILRGRDVSSTLTSFGDRRGAVEPLIGVGDVLALTIWEAGSGGLFSALPSERMTAGSRAASIPEQVVGRDGMISVPYAGRIRAAGRTINAIQIEIERQLEGKAIQPQVLLSVVRPGANTVTVIGEAAGGARLPISPKGDRVLDVIASAGGVRAPINESFIQLTRGQRSVRVAMSRVVSNARENIFVRPGDVIAVIRDPQKFLAYGASGRNAEIPFEAEGVTLAQAITKAGGLLDHRADPEGVFLFRYEHPTLAQRLDPEGYRHLPAGRGPVKVVYRLNLRDANSLFLAGRINVANNDLIYVSNAKLSDIQKLVQLFNLVAAPVGTGSNIAGRL